MKCREQNNEILTFSLTVITDLYKFWLWLNSSGDDPGNSCHTVKYRQFKKATNYVDLKAFMQLSMLNSSRAGGEGCPFRERLPSRARLFKGWISLTTR